ncbi:phosphatidylinositol transfer protein alpha isoform-like isoform X2 [Halichondria panicea]|uniref:phosphatidylinositol transfer protein alpha isoform-like isoform X1 n=1 Tax=Halichondria panicea TaxID=6063 RepID=UPI00312BAF83
MLIREFRVVMPLTLEEFQVGQLYSVAEASKNETGGGEGVEIIKNEPCDHPELGKGQFTHKIYHLASKVPKVIRVLAPKGALEIHEEAWNCYPYCKTVISNPDYMKDGFHITILTLHAENDKGEQANVHNLPKAKLDKRDVVHVDIVNDHVSSSDYKPEWDPAKFHSEKTGRGPLGSDWKETTQPLMCAYKLVECEFKWFGLQSTVESRIQKVYPRLFRNFHRQVFCWLDQWHGMTMDDIREYEAQAKAELDRARTEGEVRGTSEQ